jgi:hypothetical protein
MGKRRNIWSDSKPALLVLAMCCFGLADIALAHNYQTSIWWPFPITNGQLLAAGLVLCAPAVFDRLRPVLGSKAFGLSGFCLFLLGFWGVIITSGWKWAVHPISDHWYWRSLTAATVGSVMLIIFIWHDHKQTSTKVR